MPVLTNTMSDTKVLKLVPKGKVKVSEAQLRLPLRPRLKREAASRLKRRRHS